MDIDIDPQEPMSDVLWHNDIDNRHPFSLVAAASSPDPQCHTSFRAVTCFPWTQESLEDLWNGKFNTQRDRETWNKTVGKWEGVVAVGGGRKVRLILTHPSKPFVPLFTLSIPDIEANVTTIAWCMLTKADEFCPLLAFSGNSILYIYNVESGFFHGVLRGHGANITSLAVHPTDPGLLCSTSRDHTVRIYDLILHVACPIDNPSWPGKDTPCLAGPAFGLRANEGEGEGHGRCVAILAGGPSGGHQAAVLGAAFHPTFPLIATCGMDNTVKLWRTPPVDGKALRRADKPLFSSSRIHSSQVISINWLNQDVLLSHSGPVLMRKPESSELYKVSGSLVLWRWLGFARFFPPDQQSWPVMLRGCASDYKESSSFKIISVTQLPLPLEPVRIHVYQTKYHPPLVLIPSQGVIKAISSAHFKPREPPPFPDPDDDELSKATKRMRIDTREFVCWEIEVNQDRKNERYEVESCAVGADGNLMIGVGVREGIWIWRIPPGQRP